ncbi:MAG TPA: M56 family metallopeptidase [Terracidiphilus sp.]|nr:M56 family metallopeptidase [Terracidiphilus sp.]
MPLTTLIHAFQGATPAAVDSLSAAFRASSQQAAAVAVAAIWQGAVIACGLAIFLRLAPRTSAANRFAVWAAAFVALVSLPLFSLIPNISASVAVGVSFATSEAASRPWLSIDSRWSILIAALWAAAALFRAGDLAVHSFRLRKLWKDAIPVGIDSRLSSMLASTPAAWHRGPVQVCTTTTLQRPAVIGFFRPRILIPDWLLARLTAGELEQIVLHEAEHLRRHDDWTNLFQKLCLVLFPLNPALLWIEHRLCSEREMACDDGVIRITNAPRAYAACLASLAERGLERRAEALSLGAWQRRPELVHRVHSILRRKHTLGPLGTRALLGALGCGLLFGSIELARCPQLIAFVPARNQDRHVDAVNQTAPAHLQVVSARLINAAYVPVRSAGLAHSASAFHATKVEAMLPASGDAHLAGDQTSIKRNVSKSGVQAESKVSFTESNSHSPHPVLLKAELSSSRAVPAQEQQWIVLTTWEQVQTSSLNAGLTADYDSSANADAANDTNAQRSDQPASQFTVTRLIFRIIPANSFSTHPASGPIRSGWFVIQL